MTRIRSLLACVLIAGFLLQTTEANATDEHACKQKGAVIHIPAPQTPFFRAE